MENQQQETVKSFTDALVQQHGELFVELARYCASLKVYGRMCVTAAIGELRDRVKEAFLDQTKETMRLIFAYAPIPEKIQTVPQILAAADRIIELAEQEEKRERDAFSEFARMVEAGMPASVVFRPPGKMH